MENFNDRLPGSPKGDPPYTTQIPRLADYGKARSRRKRTERQNRYINEQTKSGDAHRYYNSTSWKSLRKIYLMTHPVDELALLEEKVLSAEHVHHLVKWFDQNSEELRWQLLLDEDNLISVTSELHNFIHYAPDRLSDVQRDFLTRAKEKLFLKYAEKGIQILVPDDLNR